MCSLLSSDVAAALALLLSVTKTTPTASTGREAHWMAARCCPSSHTANSAVGTILKLWEQIWKVTASRWDAATMTSTCAGAVWDEAWAVVVVLARASTRGRARPAA